MAAAWGAAAEGGSEKPLRRSATGACSVYREIRMNCSITHVPRHGASERGRDRGRERKTREFGIGRGRRGGVTALAGAGSEHNLLHFQLNSN